MENLNEKELIAINGGSVFESNPSSMQLSVTSSINSLLSLTIHTKHGDRETTNTLSVGNYINLGFVFGN